MPSTPKKFNLSFARNAYNVFGKRDSGTRTENQREQKTELLQGKDSSELRNRIVYGVHNFEFTLIVVRENKFVLHDDVFLLITMSQLCQ